MKKLSFALILSSLFANSLLQAEIKNIPSGSHRNELESDINKAIREYSAMDKEYDAYFQEKKRQMLDSLETRFNACDQDDDETLDIYETTICLPQIARNFRVTDINKDNLISLDELSALAGRSLRKVQASTQDKSEKLEINSAKK
ncbi:MAG: hypothetical protein VW238_04750 [Nitrosomonadales bacterium]